MNEYVAIAEHKAQPTTPCRWFVLFELSLKNVKCRHTQSETSGNVIVSLSH